MTIKGFKDDKELIGYCEIHCETPRALFNGAQIKRMHELAGEPTPKMADDSWISMHYDMAVLCKAAREKSRKTAREPCKSCQHILGDECKLKKCALIDIAKLNLSKEAIKVLKDLKGRAEWDNVEYNRYLMATIAKGGFPFGC
jgi:hypothetical protein